ncbi:class I adenylate-forming enzyme family protein [Antrihabitans sp. YC2-6]|uniref:class I adenylate-forming enzyme family protein n=1 Tax=Antrihabitans sp. YC2-6 TaxID=2799498 RepID=UPI0018F798A4|nr:AMP-binding protein [Antrihabitans sp. YC2-6]MBJ8348308.1 AMP-binding protein [Antrihabitans sp. YC2-6]
MTHQLSTLVSASDRTALRFGDRSWSYAELVAAADRLARVMTAAGLRGERVALALPNCSELVLCYLACFASGAVATPFNTRYAPPELEQALRRARPRWLITHSEKLADLARIDAAVLDSVRVLVVGDSPGRYEGFGTLRAPSDSGEPIAPDPDAPAVMFFTSGSTGRPKGVVHSHRSALGVLTSTSEALGGVTADDVTQVVEPLVHVSGFIGTMTTLMAGGTVALYDGFDPLRYVDALQQHRPTLVCTHIDIIAQVLRQPGMRREWFASLRGVYTGGDTVPAALQREFLAASGLPICVGWGMTEAIWLTINREPRLDRDGCIGVPVSGVEVRVDEATGELLVRGPMVLDHYWEDETLTAATLTDGWLHTGDLGEQDADGVWWFTGRSKDIIVRRTSKITSGEVESILDQHPGVAAAAVIGVPDPEEGQVPVAFVVARNAAVLTVDDLLSFLRNRIAEYKIPARVHFRTELPLTTSGKLNRRELKEEVP